MRIAIALAALLLGSSISVSEARCYTRSYRSHYHDHHRHYHARSYRHRPYRYTNYYRRAFYPDSSSYVGYGRGHYGAVRRSYSYRRYYRYGGGCDGWSYGGHVYYGFNPRIAVAPIYGRLSVVFTLDDAVFDGTPKSDADGLPQPRAKPVGSRFLTDG